MRLLERGHVRASRLRFADSMPACSGRRPRALALGQAAPAFLLLLQLTLMSLVILAAEIGWAKWVFHRVLLAGNLTSEGHLEMEL